MLRTPWHVTHSSRCPAARPWAVILNQDGTVVACHPTKQAANKHMAALYAQEANTMPKRHAFVAPIHDLEVRQSGNGVDFTLTGYAAVFDSWSEELHTMAGKFKERIQRGAFRSVLKAKPDVRLLFNHNEDFPLARTKSGTLELSEDDQGLRVAARIAPTSYAQDLRMAMQRGDVDQMSFAFTVADDEWDDSDEDTVSRTIRQVDKLFDVSVVTYPAYPDTEAAMRELREAIDAGKIESRAVIPFKETPKADVNSAWNGPAEVARADVEDLRAMCTWYDAANPEAKGAYKLPHHRADASHPVVWRGVAGAMQRLMGTDMPAGDRAGCHAHLGRHYAQFDREPPAMGDMMRAFELGLEPTLDACESRIAFTDWLEERSTVAEPETDAPGDQTPPDTAQPETDAADGDAGDADAPPPEDVAASGTLDDLRKQSREALIAEREKYARLLRKAVS